MKKLLLFARPYWKGFLAALFMLMAVAAADIIMPLIIKSAIDDYIVAAIDGNMALKAAEEGIVILGTVYIVISFIQFVFGYFQVYILEKTGGKIIFNLRNKLYAHVQSLPVSFFDKTPAGVIFTRIANDTNALNEMYINVLVSFFKDFFTMAGIIVMMFILNVKLALVSMLAFPLIAVSAVIFRVKARKAFTLIREKLSKINAFLSENISGIKVIKIFYAKVKKEGEFDNICRDYYEAVNTRIRIFGIFRPLMDVAKSIALALVLWYGFKGVTQGMLEIGVLYAFTSYIGKLYQPIMNMTEMFNTTQSAVIASDRINRLFEVKPEPRFRKGEKEDFKDKEGSIEFKNVWFAYDKDKYVLKDISFKINPGEKAAFVGITGAGKTSIINVLAGFYEIQKGCILIGGTDIRKISKETLRNRIGIIRQDVFMFSGTIEYNIKLNNEDVDLKRVKKSASVAQADLFINELDDGYDWMVNEGGTSLSEGQRQLVSFARAILPDPDILILDEATSSIDSHTENLIQKGMEGIMQGRTCIFIAHRLSTIEKCDRIYVISDGEIIEQGKHNELLKQRGLYYNLYSLQNKYL